MSNVVHLDARRTASFNLYAEEDREGRWHVSLNHHDRGVERSQAFREVADALIPIAGGLIIAAEGEDPSTRGALIANFSLHEDGNVTIHCPFDMTKEMQRFILTGLKRATEKIRKLPLMKGTDG